MLLQDAGEMLLGTEQEALVPWVKGETGAPPRRWDLVWTPREGEKAEGGNRARTRGSGREHHDSKLRGGKPGDVQRIAGVR